MWVQPTRRGIHNALYKRFSANPSGEITADEKLLDIAVKLVVMTFPPNHYTQPFKVLVTNDGSSGVGYECCRFKRDCMENHKSDYLDYLTHYRDRPVPIFKYMCKTEALPAAKVLADDHRAIIYPPFHFYMLQMCSTQFMDTHLKGGYHPWIWVGMNPLGPDFDRLAKCLNKFKTKFMGDITKFDASFKRKLFELVYRVRKECSDINLHDKLDFICDVLSNHLVVLPDGSVIRDGSETSGHACTTTDNCIAHLIVIYYMLCVRLTELNIPITLENVHDLAFFAIYSDDHVAATNDPVLSTFEFRSKIYAQFGLTLKKADDVVTKHITDLTFLGGRFKSYDGRYVYHYDDDNISTSWLLPSVGRTPQQNANAILSTIRLRATDEAHYQKWSQIYNDYCSAHKAIRFPFNGLAPGRMSFVYALTGFEGDYDDSARFFTASLSSDLPKHASLYSPQGI